MLTDRSYLRITEQIFDGLPFDVSFKINKICFNNYLIT